MSIVRHKLRGRIARAAAVTAIVATGVVAVPAGPAFAGGSCNFGCSETHNHSQYGVTVGRNWGNPPSPTMIIWPWEDTPDNEDWDAFRVDAGWCYHVGWFFYGIYITDKTYDQRGKGDLWVQVHNDETAVIFRQAGSGQSCT
jgi:hypothetical protein